MLFRLVVFFYFALYFPPGVGTLDMMAHLFILLIRGIKSQWARSPEFFVITDIAGATGFSHGTLPPQVYFINRGHTLS
jgi:uncharacterized membrane protein YhfC